MESIGDNGYKLITQGVKDALGTSAAQPGARVFTLTAVCTLETLQDFKLDPPRGSKSQHDVTIVSDINQRDKAGEPAHFIVESLMRVHRDAVTEIKHAMHTMLYYIATASGINTRKNKREWTEASSPAKVQTCRHIPGIRLERACHNTRASRAATPILKCSPDRTQPASVAQPPI